MSNTVILTDSCSDLPLRFIEDNDLPVVNLSFNFQGKDYADDFGKTIPHKTFYDAVRKGAMPTTSQVNVHTFTEIFKNYLEKEQVPVYIAFSSALSGTLNSAITARELILEEDPAAEIIAIDSYSASLGQGLLVYYALEMQKNGAAREEIVAWLEDNIPRMNHWFTVEDLGHLKRGGRVSSTAAFVGTVLNVRPILHVDAMGRLIPVTKVRGRNKSLKYLRDMLVGKIINPEEQVVAISHGDALEEAEQLKEMILEEVRVKDIMINNIGPIIGAHTGPGTMSLFFLGEKR
ncbi:MAG TPA: DegV family protein [Clostridia bacterium]|nr:DegV family protein [Clostridia bacterium]